MKDLFYALFEEADDEVPKPERKIRSDASINRSIATATASLRPEVQTARRAAQLRAQNTETAKNNQRQAQLGKTKSIAHRENIGTALTGRTLSDETRRKLAARERTEEEKKRIREGCAKRDLTPLRLAAAKRRGKKLSAEHATAISEALRQPDRARRSSEVARRQVTCPHCGKQGAHMIMPRWHFDNCKLKP